MSKQSGNTVTEDGLILSGYHKKLKTMKKKFFVLYKETRCNTARLEYFDSEKKYKSGIAPKRTIKLKNCFNINRRLDTKYDYVIALSTKDGTFGLVLESEEEMTKWLEILTELQRCEANISESALPQFEHVWQVTVQRNGLAESKGLFGLYYVCLTPKSVTFIRIGPEKTPSGEVRILNIEFLLTTIRRCGDSQCIFYMEVGRQSSIGPGELWMETEDTLIAQNMHQMILSAMSIKGETFFEPMRQRSSSANEASKPMNVLQRKTNQADKINASPQTVLTYVGRERSDSLPSRNRSTSESANQSFPVTSGVTIRNTTMTGLRPYSHQRYSNSPPIGCSESEESSMSIDEPDDNGGFLAYRFNSRSSEGVIPEENTEDLNSTDSKYQEKSSSILDNDCSLSTAEKCYLSMTPINNMSENSNLTSKRQEDTSPTCGSVGSHLEFPEYISDDSKNFINELETQSDRPIRAYSIGSKAEHFKIKSRLNNTNDTDQIPTRVRAFSVGSRAKIPRCDLQRSVMYPKALVEQTINSNNNTYSINDITVCNQLLNLNIYRDKKSTSAPLLNFRSPNSVDKMSDLMEIDFSKISNNSNYQPNTISKVQMPKNITGILRESGSNNREENISQNSVTSLTIKSITKTDNGYLEMKPVGNLLNKHHSAKFSVKVDNKSSSDENLANKPKKADDCYLTETVLEKKTDAVKTKNLRSNLPTVMQSLESLNAHQNSNNRFQQSAIDNENSSNSESSEQLSNICEPIKPKTPNNGPDSSKCANISLSLSMANEYITNYMNIDTQNVKKFLSTNIKLPEGGTNTKNPGVNKEEQMKTTKVSENDRLQIVISGSDILRSDDISNKLHTHSNRNRLNMSYKENDQLLYNEVVRPKSTNISSITPPSSSSPPLCNCMSSSTSCLNYFPTEQIQHESATIQDENTCIKCNNHNRKTLSKITSRPSSIALDHELHYASLDLPEGNKLNVKSKTDVFSDSLPVVVSNNSYAKIDFDHSDSSSSSSRNFNT